MELQHQLVQKQENKNSEGATDTKGKKQQQLEMVKGNHQGNRWLDRLENRWTGEEQDLLWVKKKGSEHEIGVTELDRGERGDSCHTPHWLNSGKQRQTPFSNPIVSAGYCHPAQLCKPVNMHPIPSRNHTHRHASIASCKHMRSLNHTCNGVIASDWTVATHKQLHARINTLEENSPKHIQGRRKVLKKQQDQMDVFTFFSLLSLKMRN